jgi:hypothetical protein
VNWIREWRVAGTRRATVLQLGRINGTKLSGQSVNSELIPVNRQQPLNMWRRCQFLHLVITSFWFVFFRISHFYPTMLSKLCQARKKWSSSVRWTVPVRINTSRSLFFVNFRVTSHKSLVAHGPYYLTPNNSTQTVKLKFQFRAMWIFLIPIIMKAVI